MLSHCPALVSLPVASCVLRATCVVLASKNVGDDDVAVCAARNLIEKIEKEVSALNDVAFNNRDMKKGKMVLLVHNLYDDLNVDEPEMAESQDRELMSALYRYGLGGEESEFKTALYSLRHHLKLAHEVINE